MSRQFVVVGAGYCGMAAVEALRGGGFDGRVVMIGEEPHYPYERPPLSKAYLRGVLAREELLPRPDSWYAEHRVEALLSTRVRAVNTAEGVVELVVRRRSPLNVGARSALASRDARNAHTCCVWK